MLPAKGDWEHEGTIQSTVCARYSIFGTNLFAANVLLTRAEGQDKNTLAVGILGLPDEAAGHLAQELRATGKQAQLGAAE